MNKYSKLEVMAVFMSLAVLLIVCSNLPIVKAQQYYDDYSDVLLVCNAQSSDSQSICSYFTQQRSTKGFNSSHIVNLTNVLTDETVDCSEYDKIYNQINSWLGNNSNQQINYIVTTTGVPLRACGKSVDSILASKWGANSNPADTTSNNYTGVEDIFKHSKYGGYLVTRLTGINITEAEALIDRSTNANATGKFLINNYGMYSWMFNDVKANSSIFKNGFTAEVNNTGFVRNKDNLLGYWSWGSNWAYIGCGTSACANTTLWNLSFNPGAIAETAVSTGGRTFASTWSSGQSLITDLITAGVTGVKGYVYEPYPGAVAVPDILFDRYTKGYNLADSYYMASSVRNWMDVVVGDPKTYITKTGINPSITISQLLDGEAINSGTPINLTINSLSFAIDKVWYNYNGTNIFLSSPYNQIDTSSWANNAYTINISSNNSIGNMGLKLISVNITNINGSTPKYVSFNGNTTNFASKANRFEVSNAILEKQGSGKIEWNVPINVSGLDLDKDVMIKQDYISVSGNSLSNLNQPANITLYNPSQYWSNNLTVFRDNHVCDSTTTPACYNYTSLNASEVKIGIPGFSTYYILGDIGYIDSCQTIDHPGYYIQTADLSGDNCIDIESDNVTFNGNGFKTNNVYYNAYADSININGNNVIIDNVNFDYGGIYVVTGSKNITIENSYIGVDYEGASQGGIILDYFSDPAHKTSNVNILNNVFYYSFNQDDYMCSEAPGINIYADNVTLENNTFDTLSQCSDSYYPMSIVLSGSGFDSTFITPDNKVNNQLIYQNRSLSNYIYNSTNSPNASMIMCLNCNNVTVKNLDLKTQVQLYNSNNSKIENITNTDVSSLGKIKYDQNDEFFLISGGVNNSVTNINMLDTMSLTPIRLDSEGVLVENITVPDSSLGGAFNAGGIVTRKGTTMNNISGGKILVIPTSNGTSNLKNINLDSIGTGCGILAEPFGGVYLNLSINNYVITNSGCALHLNGDDNSYIRVNNVTGTGLGSYGIGIYGLKDVKLSNMTFSGGTPRFSISSSNGIQINDVLITGSSGSDYVSLTNSQNINFTNVTTNLTETIDATSSLNRKWYLDVFAQNLTGLPGVPHINIISKDKNNLTEGNSSTDLSGTLRQELTEYIANSTDKIYLSNYSISAYNDTQSVLNTTLNISQNRYLNFLTSNIIYPNATLLTPINNTITSNSTQNLSANLTDKYGIANITLYVYNSTGLVNSSTQTYSPGIIQTTIGAVFNLADNVYHWFAQLFNFDGNSYTTANNTLTIDTTPPFISFITPGNNTYNSRTQLINLSTMNSSNIWFYNGSANVTYILPVNITLTEGSNTLTAYANDSAGNLNSTSITFTIDTIAPQLSIVYPTATTYSSNVSSLSYSLNEIHQSSCWYSLNGGLTNVSFSCGASLVNLTSVQGLNTWTIWANDTAGNKNSSSVSFYKYIPDYPVISLTSPEDGSQATSGVVRFMFNVSDNLYSISQCSLNYQGGVYATITNVSESQTNVIEVTGVEANHPLFSNDLRWFINCTNDKNYSNVSATRDLDTKGIEVVTTGGSGGSSTNVSNQTSTQTTTTGLGYVNLYYNKQWVPGTEEKITIDIFNTQNQEYLPDDVRVSDNVDGIKYESIEKSNNKYVATFSIDKNAKMGTKVITITVNDGQTKTATAEIDIGTTSTSNPLSTSQVYTYLIWSIGGLVVILILVLIVALVRKNA